MQVGIPYSRELSNLFCLWRLAIPPTFTQIKQNWGLFSQFFNVKMDGLSYKDLGSDKPQSCITMQQIERTIEEIDLQKNGKGYYIYDEKYWNEQ